MGKGDKRRPALVRDEHVAAEWGRIFGPKAVPGERDGVGPGQFPSGGGRVTIEETDVHPDADATGVP